MSKNSLINNKNKAYKTKTISLKILILSSILLLAIFYIPVTNALLTCRQEYYDNTFSWMKDKAKEYYDSKCLKIFNNFSTGPFSGQNYLDARQLTDVDRLVLQDYKRGNINTYIMHMSEVDKQSFDYLCSNEAEKQTPLLQFLFFMNRKPCPSRLRYVNYEAAKAICPNFASLSIGEPSAYRA